MLGKLFNNIFSTPTSGLGKCSREIFKTAKYAGCAVFVKPTTDGIIVKPLHGGEYTNIGSIELSRRLMASLRSSTETSSLTGQALEINPSIAGGIIKKCLKSIILRGSAYSVDILSKSGIKMRSDVEISARELKDTTDLANYMSHHFRNLLFGFFEGINDAQALARQLEKQFHALKLSKILCQRTEGIEENLSKILKDLRARVETLMSCEKRGKEIIKSLDGLLEDKTGQATSELLNILPAINDRLRDQLKVTDIQGIKNQLEAVDKINMDSGRAAFKTLDTLIINIRNSGSEISKIVDKIILFSSAEKPPTPEMLINSLSGKGTVSESEEIVPEITKEMAGRISVLIVDDTADVRNVLRSRFESLGFMVKTAENGKLGIEAYDRGSFDIIFSDYLMPEMNGIELIKTIRQKNKDIPIYIVSGTPLQSSAVLSEFIFRGFADFIVKDFLRIEKILYPAVHLALKKAGIEVKEVEEIITVTDKPKQPVDPLKILKGRIAHKLNNTIAPLSGYLELSLTDKECLADVKIGYKRILKELTSIKSYAAEIRKRPKGDVSLLPEDLINDKEFGAAVTELIAQGDERYYETGNIASAIAGIYEIVLSEIGRKIDELDRSGSTQTIESMEELVRILICVNRVMAVNDIKSATELAAKTIELMID